MGAKRCERAREPTGSASLFLGGVGNVLLAARPHTDRIKRYATRDVFLAIGVRASNSSSFAIGFGGSLRVNEFGLVSALEKQEAGNRNGIGRSNNKPRNDTCSKEARCNFFHLYHVRYPLLPSPFT